jgi:hypothetical protein
MAVEFNLQHAADCTKGVMQFPNPSVLIYNSENMDGKLPIHQRTWFFVLSWSLAALIFYVWQIFRMGGFVLNLTTIILDGILFLTNLILWVAFFSQFVLPVNRLADRNRIFSHLFLHLTGGHGPAILVEDGKERARKEELKKRGPGVVWLDSASAAQLRTSTKFTRSIGPGVHFTESGEYIAGIVDLHVQSQTIGVEENDQPFEPRPETMSLDEYAVIQKRAAETRALTRDGIDVVAKISTTFKVDCDPMTDDGPGSRFGYNEPVKGQENHHPVFKAIANEGVNPEKSTSSKELKTVAWNQFPAYLAADLWREYLSKFTLLELFDLIIHNTQATSTASIMEMPKAAEPAPVVKAVAKTSAWQRRSDRLLQQTNRYLSQWVKRLERTVSRMEEEAAAEAAAGSGEAERKLTALNIINEMIKERMTKPLYNEMDENGKFTGRKLESQEYNYLKSRGLRVLSVSASDPRFSQKVEEGLVNRWSSTWEANAKARREAIEQQRKVIEMRGHEQGSLAYLHELSLDLARDDGAPPKDVSQNTKDTLKKLVLHSRNTLIGSDRLERRLGSEIDELDEIIRWLESGA